MAVYKCIICGAIYDEEKEGFLYQNFRVVQSVNNQYLALYHLTTAKKNYTRSFF